MVCWPLMPDLGRLPFLSEVSLLEPFAGSKLLKVFPLAGKVWTTHLWLNRMFPLSPSSSLLGSIFLSAKEHTLAPFLPQTAFCRQGFHSLLLFSHLSLASSTYFGLHCAVAKLRSQASLLPPILSSQPSGLLTWPLFNKMAVWVPIAHFSKALWDESNGKPPSVF